MTLQSMGWSAFFESKALNYENIARITAIHRSHIRAMKTEYELNLYVPGAQNISLAVGDWVLTSPEFVDEQNHVAAMVTERLPRKSRLSRMGKSGEQIFASNIDTVFIVTSVNQDLNINRLQRFLVLVREGRCEPVVVLSKMDLQESSKFETIQKIKNNTDIKVVATSLVTGMGISELTNLLPIGSSSVFVGSSGVGKSSLVNQLLGTQSQAINDIRLDDGKGRHTTTSRQMFLIPEGGWIIDTPGVREVQVFGANESLNQTFPIVEELTKRCRFNNCQHSGEPGCAIEEALKSGQLAHNDWENYSKLLKEMAWANRKIDKVEMSNTKKRWKQIHKNMRQRRKLERGGS